MTPVIHCSTGNIHFFPRATFTTRKEIQLTKHNINGNHNRLTPSSERFLSSQSSLRLFQIYRSGFLAKHGSGIRSITAVRADVTVEEPNLSVSVEDAEKTTEDPTSDVETSETAPKDPTVTSDRTKRSRPARKSEMPPVKDEDLVPGASFTGKVRSIQPFGAFVDFGAFTDGLVHVSRMSDDYVKDVASLVSVGQEVKVRIVEANMETKRISLTMRDNDDARKMPPRRESSTGQSSDRPRSSRKNAARSAQKRGDEQKKSNFVKGQVLTGTVKNTIRAGSFVSLPDGEEGFIPVSEESEGFGNVSGNSSLQVGQEVNVRVLRIARGRVTLTMKKEEDVEELNRQLNKGVWHAATNPFELAFRKNEVISSFLDEREKAQKSSENISLQKNSEEIEEKVDDAIINSVTLTEDESTASEEVLEESPSAKSTSTEHVNDVEEPERNLPQAVNDVSETLLKDMQDPSVEVDTSSAINEAPVVDEVTVSGEVKETDTGNASVSEDETSSKSLSSQENGKSADPVTGDGSAGQVDGGILSEQIQVPEEGDETQAESTTVEDKLETETPVLMESKAVSVDANDAKSEIPETPEIPETSNGQTAKISPALVKQLREESGAGMMDCKNALSETGGDIVKAQELLRKKGLASADKKSSRATAEGRIGSYIHDSRIGVLMEVNCETDFVARGEIFKQLVDDLAMQVAACPQVRYMVTEDVPEEIVSKEREIEMQKEDLLSKPENIRSKIVDGRIRKRLEEFALLEQPYIKNDKMVVKDWVKQTIATIGENIKVRRFVRYNLGEGLEKKSQDFAAEVAAQTSAKEAPAAAPKEQPVETQETVEKPPAAAVSAALVKQLREETGAGMMDCKKALTETGGDLEKAQEYLRKKGLSSADKKSSRLAVEGRISSYIHDSRIGVLIEVNSETDFVARNEKFKELVDDLAMQVVACPQVEYVSVEDIPQDIVNKEKEIEMQRDDLKSKPDNIKEKIVEGRISKRLGELALLEQPFIKDDKLIVKDLVKQTIAALGENIKVRRFVRFTLGETKD
ncbi:uncharacterized protein A4U43_C08F22520 [Asparagus officinalis]|uniref:uncharacterized protein LOC109820088 n=1 Tax=Asparagus officinalis TaxID=4686 RepID=UPI00098E3C9A|nr:uncharacterized protein LOC109820088 [Asparagus officinalis]ONK60779.1 uncharacterized protein A4U43_C08F22520 [Asparagus officinalis]